MSFDKSSDRKGDFKGKGDRKGDFKGKKNGDFKKRDDKDFKKRDGFKKRDDRDFKRKDGFKKDRDFDKKRDFKKKDFDKDRDFKKKDGYKKDRDFDKKRDFKKRDDKDFKKKDRRDFKKDDDFKKRDKDFKKFERAGEGHDRGKGDDFKKPRRNGFYSDFSVGARVYHGTFGEGEIQQRGRNSLVVKFDDREKPIRLAFPETIKRRELKIARGATPSVDENALMWLGRDGRILYKRPAPGDVVINPDLGTGTVKSFVNGNLVVQFAGDSRTYKFPIAFKLGRLKYEGQDAYAETIALAAEDDEPQDLAEEFVAQSYDVAYEAEETSDAVEAAEAEEITAEPETEAEVEEPAEAEAEVEEPAAEAEADAESEEPAKIQE